jgi:hypothetical protein
MLGSVGRLAAVLLMLVLVNGHSGALQAMAWARMLWTYSQQTESFVVAAKQTVDGEHPCRMCHSIKEAKGKEKDSPMVLATAKNIKLFAGETGNPLPERVWWRFEFPGLMDERREARFAEPQGKVPIGMVLAA